MHRDPIDVLLLDDDPDICVMAEAVLKFSGFSVQSTTTHIGLYELLEQLRPKALLMDMLLSGADGRDICRQLKSDSRNNHIHIVMMSAHPDAGVTCLEAGAEDFIEKPFELDSFLSKMKAATGLADKNLAMDQDSSS